MRDQAIIRMQQANNQRNALVLGQFEFLKTRQEAAELILRASSLWDRLRWVLVPAAFLAAVDRLQMHLLNEAKKQMASAAAKPHIVKAPAGSLAP